MSSDGHSNVNEEAAGELPCEGLVADARRYFVVSEDDPAPQRGKDLQGGEPDSPLIIVLVVLISTMAACDSRDYKPLPVPSEDSTCNRWAIYDDSQKFLFLTRGFIRDLKAPPGRDQSAMEECLMWMLFDTRDAIEVACETKDEELAFQAIAYWLERCRALAKPGR